MEKPRPSATKSDVQRRNGSTTWERPGRTSNHPLVRINQRERTDREQEFAATLLYDISEIQTAASKIRTERANQLRKQEGLPLVQPPVNIDKVS